jgi:NAD(P)H-hydrate epimerase
MATGESEGSGLLIQIRSEEVLALSAQEMREVDRIMVEELHVDLLQMMENAGRSLAELAIRRFGGSRVTVLAGPGGNGGGGLAAARHLHNRGVAVRVTPAHPAGETSPAAARQLDILRRIGIPVFQEPEPADLVVDALLGYSLRGDPQGRVAELIEWANAQPAPILSLDTPSGLDVTSGMAATPCVRATATLTLGLPKTGLLHAPEVGELYLADISIPQVVYERLGVRVPVLFASGQIVRIAR